MKKSNQICCLVVLLMVLIFISSCNNKQEKPEQEESNTSGKLTVYCDESIYNLMEAPFKMYDSSFPNVELNIIKTNSFDAMSQLLSGKARVIIIARDYLKNEDSLMQVYKVKPYVRMVSAEDGLVFYTQKDFPLDTMNISELKEVLINKESSFKKYYKLLANEPELVCNNNYSSEYANLYKLVAQNNTIHRKLKIFSNSDTVKNYVLNNKNAIGIGYLSSVIKDTSNLKILRLGFVDTTGKYKGPNRKIEQATLVMGEYPYIIKHYVYIQEDIKNLPWWFATFMAKEKIVQSYFLGAGIVPAYAKFILKEEE